MIFKVVQPIYKYLHPLFFLFMEIKYKVESINFVYNRLNYLFWVVYQSERTGCTLRVQMWFISLYPGSSPPLFYMMGGLFTFLLSHDCLWVIITFFCDGCCPCHQMYYRIHDASCLDSDTKLICNVASFGWESSLTTSKVAPRWLGRSYDHPPHKSLLFELD